MLLICDERSFLQLRQASSVGWQVLLLSYLANDASLMAVLSRHSLGQQKQANRKSWKLTNGLRPTCGSGQV